MINADCNRYDQYLSGGTSAYPAYQNPYAGYWHIGPTTPTECSGDVHVFPCKKCRDCKCGKAKLARDDKK